MDATTPSTPPSSSARTVIPMHYDTFPAIETDAEAFKAEVEKLDLVARSSCSSRGRLHSA